MRERERERGRTSERDKAHFIGRRRQRCTVCTLVNMLTIIHLLINQTKRK